MGREIENIVTRSELNRLYPGADQIASEERLDAICEEFQKTYGQSNPRLFSAPGRTELGGNHTDHQLGLVIAAAVDIDNVAAALPNGENVVRVFSESYGATTVDLTELSPKNEELGTPAALIRGVAEYFAVKGYGKAGGFNAFVSGKVPVGSGLSSSAAFEVLIARVINGLFFDGQISAELMACAGQYAENVHFGKPCGLMDQMASAVGGVIEIDFEKPEKPKIERLSVDISEFGYALCIIDTGAKHDHLASEYAAIPAEMSEVARLLGAEKLRGASKDKFFKELPKLREKISDRAVLRALHYFDENERVLKELDCLKRKDFEDFLKLVDESGKSSWMLLQNIYPNAAVEDQSAAVVLAFCQKLLGRSGACRIHGGGFGGTIQAFVPLEATEEFKNKMEHITGLESCHFIKLRDAGAVEIVR